MQIPAPKPEPILTALLIAIVVLIFRWIGIFLLVLTMGGNYRLAAVATINLSEVSEFALVICSLGISFCHIESDTLTIMIWVFAILAISAANLLPYNYKIYAYMVGLVDKLRGQNFRDCLAHEIEEHAEEGRNIVFLGFHKVAAMLLHDLSGDAPEILHKVHVVDFNEKTLNKLKTKGISSAYGDISCPDVLEHAVHGEARLVLITIPDNQLRGTTNLKLLKIALQVWPECKVIATSDNTEDTERLYAAGAAYVLRSSHLCADKLAQLLKEFTTHGKHESCDNDVLDKHSKNEMTTAIDKERDSRISVVKFH